VTDVTRITAGSPGERNAVLPDRNRPSERHAQENLCQSFMPSSHSAVMILRVIELSEQHWHTAHDLHLKPGMDS
jgi:hypothetical protein